jgi:exopolysaccharide biosynthesis polyprenyl glycosylphosphotransferase
MLKRSSCSFTFFLLISDLALTETALFLAYRLRLVLSVGVGLGPEGRWLRPYPILYLVVPLIYGIIFNLLPVYDRRRTLRAVDDLQLVGCAIMLSILVFAGVAYFFFQDLSRLLFLYFLLLDFFLLAFWRVLLRIAFRLWHGGWPREKRRVAIVGAGKVGLQVGQALRAYEQAGLSLVGYLDDAPPTGEDGHAAQPILGKLDEVAQVVTSYNIQELVIALPLHAHKRVRRLVTSLRSVPVCIRIVPDYFDLSFFKTGIEEFAGLPLVNLREPVLDPFQRAAKRSFDLVSASLLFMLSLPLMGAVALAVKFDSPGPIFFRQKRVGEGGRVFEMLKFRSMVADAEARWKEVVRHTPDGQVIFKQKNDPRVTRVGRFIRRTSLDELPQLVNVLKGEMSLVGPRPEMPWLVEHYEPWQRQRFEVPQGITGWWQVNGRGDKPMHLHTEEDLYYIQHYSLLLDLRILWKTLAAVVKRQGAF